MPLHLRVKSYQAANNLSQKCVICFCFLATTPYAPDGLGRWRTYWYSTLKFGDLVRSQPRSGPWHLFNMLTHKSQSHSSQQPWLTLSPGCVRNGTLFSVQSPRALVKSSTICMEYSVDELLSKVLTCINDVPFRDHPCLSHSKWETAYQDPRNTEKHYNSKNNNFLTIHQGNGLLVVDLQTSWQEKKCLKKTCTLPRRVWPGPH